MDLIINTLSLPCVGTLVDPSLLPCVGLGAYDTDAAGTLSTELQLYTDAAQGWAAVQQRSPPATGRHVRGSLLCARLFCLVCFQNGGMSR